MSLSARTGTAATVPKAGRPGPGPRPLHRHPAFRATLLAAGAATLGLAVAWEGIADPLFALEARLAGLLPTAWIARSSWLALPGVALAAGLLASLSPCVLPLVPLNVALIGASEARGGRAVARSGAFVLGAAAALSVLGLAADLAGVLLIEQRGAVLLATGALMVALALLFLEVLPLPFAGRAPGGAAPLGRLGPLAPVAAGALFALVTTPCASPLLAAVLAAAAAQAVPGLSVASMGAFALGYTGLVFAAGVFGGGLVRRLRRRSFEAPRAAAAAVLLAAGLGFAAAGLRWF